MRWWVNAAIQGTLARIPGGDTLRIFLRERFGELRHLERSSRFENARVLLSKACQSLGGIEERRVVELGTGWIPVVPLAFLLCGAHLKTFDIVKLVRPRYIRRMLKEMQHHLTDYASAANIDPADIQRRFQRIEHLDDFEEIARDLGGAYHAPCDTARLPLSDESVDLVVSNLVLQCVPQDVLAGLLKEIERILKPDGVAVHRMSLNDEYAREDPHRNHLEYLRYSETTWNRWFNHKMKHLNRLRCSQFRERFRQSGMEIIDENRLIDRESIPFLKGIPLAEPFRHLDWDDLATVTYEVVLRKNKRHGQPAGQGEIVKTERKDLISRKHKSIPKQKGALFFQKKQAAGNSE